MGIIQDGRLEELKTALTEILIGNYGLGYCMAVEKCKS
jgi:hypothetical protein